MQSKLKQGAGAIAQSVEQRTENPCVPGSIPGGTTEKAQNTICVQRLFLCLGYYLNPINTQSTTNQHGSPAEVCV